MNVREENGHVYVENITDFRLGQTLECGQCFRFYRLNEDDYIVVARNKAVHIEQTEDELIFYNTELSDFETIWYHYFDLDMDYAAMKSKLLEKDQKLKDAMKEKYGVRILNQDFFEVLISFIISQNKHITHIKQIVETICTKYGEPVGTIDGKTYYSFPDASRLSKVSEEEFRECKTGFRAPYLVDACSRIAGGEITAEELFTMDTNKASEKLLTIKGVGDKVCNCILLFGLARREAFPVDVWVKRIMEKLYFGETTKNEVIKEFALQQFGEYGGYAQQYLFYFARDEKKENRKKEKK